MSIPAHDPNRSRWIPWVFVGGMMVVVVVNGVLIFQALTTFTGVTVGQSYDRGRTYNRVLDEAARQDALGWQLQASVEDGRVTVTARDRADAPIAGVLEAHLLRPLDGERVPFPDVTGAGRFVLANGGTLLLDEVGELPLELQAKLLRVLQEGEVTPVGGDRPLKVDVRVLAATHVDLDAAAAAGRFRSDLLYRLNVFPLPLPPLRERLEDLPLLCAALLKALGTRKGRAFDVTPEGLAHLARHTWPGNIRELGNVLERATILTSAEALTPDVLDLPSGAQAPSRAPRAAAESASPDGGPDLRTLEDVERDHIRAVLRHTEGRLYGAKGAAKVLGMKPTTLQSRMKKLGVERVE